MNAISSENHGRPKPVNRGGSLCVWPLLAMVACGGENGTTDPDPVVDPPVATSVTVAPGSAALSALGETVQLTATVLDQNGQTMTGASLSWTSNDASVASVENGLVTAVANGTATVTAASGNASGTASVTVSQVAAQVNVAPDMVTLSSVRDTVRMSAEAIDARGNAIGDAAFQWSSDDEGIASVDADGLVTAVANGTATVTASFGSASGMASVTVSQVAAQVNVAPEMVTLSSVGDTVRMSAEAIDARGNAIGDAAFQWSSDDEGIASVDADGLVTAVANGTATVTAASGRASGSASVTVLVELVGIQVTPRASTLFALDDTLRLTAEGVDANGDLVSGIGVTWTSENDRVAAVDMTGLVTAVRTGSVVIYAVSENLVDSAAVTVAQLAVRVVVTPEVDTLDVVGDMVQLSGWRSTRTTIWLRTRTTSGRPATRMW